MSSVLRTIEFLWVSLWLGSDVFLSFVVAPGAFGILASRDQAGAMVWYFLTPMHWGGIALGIVFLLARLARTLKYRQLYDSCRDLRSPDDRAYGHLPVHG